MWSITSDETDTISSYPISLNDSGILTICLAGIDEIPTNLGMLWLNVKGVLKHDTPWADKGHIVVEQQFDIVTSNVPEMKVELFDANKLMSDKLLGETRLNLKVLFDPKENR